MYQGVWMQSVHDAVHRAPSHVARGEIYERRGDVEHALEEYALFVEFWDNADAEYQPLVADVKGRISRLAGEPEGR